jgi:hypothetical protein
MKSQNIISISITLNILLKAKRNCGQYDLGLDFETPSHLGPIILTYTLQLSLLQLILLLGFCIVWMWTVLPIFQRHILPLSSGYNWVGSIGHWVNFCWSSPAQSPLVQSHAGLRTIFFCLTTPEVQLTVSVCVYVGLSPSLALIPGSARFLSSAQFPDRLSSLPTHPPLQWVLGALSLGVKQQGHEADNSPPSCAKVKKGGAIPPLSHISSWHIYLL